MCAFVRVWLELELELELLVCVVQSVAQEVFPILFNVDVAGLSVAGLSIGEILNGHLGKCPLEIYMS